jgi:hypothetical protein
MNQPTLEAITNRYGFEEHTVDELSTCLSARNLFNEPDILGEAAIALEIALGIFITQAYNEYAEGITGISDALDEARALDEAMNHPRRDMFGVRGPCDCDTPDPICPGYNDACRIKAQLDKKGLAIVTGISDALNEALDEECPRLESCDKCHDENCASHPSNG